MRTRDLSKMGRRRFLKSLSTLGLSTAAVTGLSKESLAKLTDNPEKEVPRLGWYRHTNQAEVRNNKAAPIREPEYYTIPRDRWERTQAAYNAAEKIASKVTDPYVDVGVTNRGNSEGLSVLVEAITIKTDEGILSTGNGKIAKPGQSLEEINQTVPNKVDATVSYSGKNKTISGIPVVVEETTLKEETQRSCGTSAPAASYFSEVYRPVPGGCEAGQSPGGEPNDWTLGTPAYSRNVNDYVMITAAHCVGRQSGTPVYQNSSTSSNHVGTSTNNYLPSGSGDAAEIEMEGTYATYSVANNTGGYYRNIVGSVGQDRVADMAYNGTSIYVQGRRTGRHYEPVADHTTGSQGGHKVKVLASTDGGDSGGIYFELKNGDAYTVGVHAWGPCIGNIKGAAGNTMYYIEDELDVYV